MSLALGHLGRTSIFTRKSSIWMTASANRLLDENSLAVSTHALLRDDAICAFGNSRASENSGGRSDRQR